MLNDANNDSAVTAQLVEAAHRTREGDSETAKVFIARAIALLRGDLHTTPTGARPQDRSAAQVVRGGLASWQARRLTAHIDTHLAESIRVEELAALIGVSVGHFCRAFKVTFGIPAHAYITRRRIEVAQGLMLTTGEPLGGIALSCGMSDQSHFTRLFRRLVGETPDAWRRSRRGTIEDRATKLAYPLASPRSLAITPTVT
jgi:AraC family transcriptional regulator